MNETNEELMYSEDFEEVWGLYPRKKGKRSASTFYVRLRRKYSKDQILDAVVKHAKSVQNKRKQYIAHGSTFFRANIYDYLSESLDLDIDNYEVKKDFFTKVVDYYRDMNYKDYLNTKHWKHFRQEVLKFYNYKCQVCDGINGLQVHHKNYNNLGRETFNDVVLLCRECHRKIHDQNE